MSEKGASEGLPCDVKALALQLAHLGHLPPQDPVALAGGLGEFLEDRVVLAGVQKWFLEDRVALAGGRGEVLAWVYRFSAFQAFQSAVGFLFQDVLAVC